MRKVCLKDNVLYFQDDEFIKFRATITEVEPHFISGKIENNEEYLGGEEDSKWEQYLEFTLRWDGTHHLHFGSKGYLCFFDENAFIDHNWIMMAILLLCKLFTAYDQSKLQVSLENIVHHWESLVNFNANISEQVSEEISGKIKSVKV